LRRSTCRTLTRSTLGCPMIETHCGDSTSLFPHCSFADVMVVDPPYRAAVHKNATSQSVGGGARHRDLGFDHLTPVLRRQVARWASEVKRWSVIYSDLESVAWWKISLEAAGATYIRSIPWVRWSMPSLCAWPPQGAEMVIIAYGRNKGRKVWNGPGNLTHLAHKCLRGEDKHRSEKPLDQLLDLVAWFSDPGEVVFDPLMGSGTTGLAATLLGRSFCGVELDPVWEERAKTRIVCAPELAPRDAERNQRWLASQTLRSAEMERLKAHTAKVRKKAEGCTSPG
jgi:site-specific DNA-methyltransferase (adenine-specific)